MSGPQRTGSAKAAGLQAGAGGRKGGVLQGGIGANCQLGYPPDGGLLVAKGKKLLDEVIGRIFMPASPLKIEGKTVGASKIIECVYEGGILRPLHEVDFKEGERLKLAVKKFDISKFVGAFGEGSMEELGAFREEALMSRCDLSEYYGKLGKASAERLAELEGSGCSDNPDLLSAEIVIENRSPVRQDQMHNQT